MSKTRLATILGSSGMRTACEMSRRRTSQVRVVTVTTAIVARGATPVGEVSVRPNRNYFEPLDSGEVFRVGCEDRQVS
jgi:hypothetical protein